MSPAPATSSGAAATTAATPSTTASGTSASGSSASTGTGPHRFRSSAASFSPSQPSNIQLHQQPQQQQQHQQHHHLGPLMHPMQSPQLPHLMHQQVAAQQQLYQQYLYANGIPPPMNVNPYSGYPQYMPQNPYIPMPAAAYNQFMTPYGQPAYGYATQPNGFGHTHSGYPMHKNYNGGYKGNNYKGRRIDRESSSYNNHGGHHHHTNHNNNSNNHNSHNNSHKNGLAAVSSATSSSGKDTVSIETPETTPASTTPPSLNTPLSSSSASSSLSESTPEPEVDAVESLQSAAEASADKKQAIVETTPVPEVKKEEQAQKDEQAKKEPEQAQKAPEPEPIVPFVPVDTLPTVDSQNKSDSFPIYFNVKPTEFAACVKKDEEFFKSVATEKEEMLKNTPVKHSIVKGEIEVIEYKPTQVAPVTPTTPAAASGKVNWANLLQKKAGPLATSSALASAVGTPKKTAATSNSTGYHASQVASTVQPSSSQPSAAGSATSASTSFPLGVVLLKLMFEPTDSPFAHDFPIFKIKPRGLTNTGNICYMNAVLQSLLYCEPFNRILKFIDNKTVGSLSTKSQTPLLDITINFFKEFSTNISSNSTKALSPEKFYSSLTKLSKFSHLKWGQQEDAEEFLGYFLDGLHEEFVFMLKQLLVEQAESISEDPSIKLYVKNTMKIIQKNSGANGSNESEEDDNENEWNEAGSKKKVSVKRTVEIEPTPITSLFGGQFRSVLTIPKSKESQSITLDPFQCIQLDISDSRINTIEDAFKIFNEPENIPYKTSTSSEVIAKKQTFIDQLPNVMIIHLKRFSYDQQFENKTENKEFSGNGVDGDLNENIQSQQQQQQQNIEELSSFGVGKLRKKVKYSHTFILPSECISQVVKKQQQNLSKTYRLIGVIYHHGNSTDGGHYTADVLRRSSVFDDEEEFLGKKFDNEWIRIDDTQIQQVDRLDVLNGDEGNKTAYILMYQKL